MGAGPVIVLGAPRRFGKPMQNGAAMEPRSRIFHTPPEPGRVDDGQRPAGARGAAAAMVEPCRISIILIVALIRFDGPGRGPVKAGEAILGQVGGRPLVAPGAFGSRCGPCRLNIERAVRFRTNSEFLAQIGSKARTRLEPPRNSRVA